MNNNDHKDDALTLHQDMLAVAAVDFANNNRSGFAQFLKEHHPYLYKVYFSARSDKQVN